MDIGRIEGRRVYHNNKSLPFFPKQYVEMLSRNVALIKVLIFSNTI